MNLEKAKQILNKGNKKKYTDQEIKEIMDILILFVKIDVKRYLNEKGHIIH